VNAEASLPVLLAEITDTSVAPTVPLGVTQLRVVALATATWVQALDPMFTAESLPNLVPEIVIFVPPITGPLFGKTDVTAGPELWNVN
jgi:hypothetical protein